LTSHIPYPATINATHASLPYHHTERRRKPYLAKAGAAAQEPPHATLPCTMIGQGRVILSPFAYKYREAEKKEEGEKKRKKQGGNRGKKEKKENKEEERKKKEKKRKKQLTKREEIEQKQQNRKNKNKSRRDKEKNGDQCAFAL
jgi:hypothetical protein